tara:strand:+ start:577 stop:693 length:117 start_codon:yes stop_codon:yes gene_type:complete
MTKKDKKKSRPIRQNQGTYERVVENKKRYNRKKIKKEI